MRSVLQLKLAKEKLTTLIRQAAFESDELALLALHLPLKTEFADLRQLRNQSAIDL